MAYPLAFRLAVGLALKSGPAVQFLTRYVMGPGIASGYRYSEELRRMLADPSVSDEELSARASLENGTVVQVATYTGDFEVRRVQIEWSLTSEDLLDEDVRVVTFHHVKLAGGLPSSDWQGPDFNALQDLYSAWWTRLLPWFNSHLIYTAIKFYREGPNIVPPQPPAYYNDSYLIAGGAINTGMMPPQAAVTVTERAGTKKGWGRFYMPAPAMANGVMLSSSPYGRVSADYAQALLASTDTLYTAAKGVLLPHVVYRPYLPAGRKNAKGEVIMVGGEPIAERPANAQTVEELAVDDVWDVIRKRRYESPKTRYLGGPIAQAKPGPSGATEEPAEEGNESQQGEQAQPPVATQESG